MISGTVARPADSTVFAASPRATVSQLAANPSSSTMPIAREPVERGPRAGGTPSRRPTPMMTASAIRLRSVVATTWPVSTAPRETSMTLNRLMMPFVMSSFTAVAVAPSP